jgi:hypothetical protein
MGALASPVVKSSGAARCSFNLLCPTATLFTSLVLTIAAIVLATTQRHATTLALRLKVDQPPHQPDLLRAAEQIVGAVLPRGFLAGDSSRGNGLPQCANPIVYRYEFWGGYGDCLKGLVTVAQVAYLLGCPLRADFSRHPLGAALPWAPDLLAPSELHSVSQEDARFYTLLNWQGDKYRRARDALLAGMVPPASALRTKGAVITGNTHSLAQLLSNLSESPREPGLSQLERALWGSIYVSAIDGLVLGSLWPTRSMDSPYRIAVHVRMGDKFLLGGKETDERNEDLSELTTALRAIGPVALALASVRAMGDVFICADTQGARDMVREAIVPQGLSVFEPPSPPIHIGLKSSRTTVNATRAVVREHLTLASADAIFMGSFSGFSTTACAIASATRSGVVCFLRARSGWRLFDPWTEGWR